MVYRLKTICDRLADELSKSIFWDRLAFSVTNDYSYIFHIMKSYEKMGKIPVSNLLTRRFYEEVTSGRKIIIYGAGMYGILFFNILKELNANVVCYCDTNYGNYENGKMGLRVISISEAYAEFPDAMIVITPKQEEKEIADYIISHSEYKRENLFWGSVCTEETYFEKGIFRFTKNEVFVDGGRIREKQHCNS